MILKNGNAFCGWIIDFDGNKIRRAPHAGTYLSHLYLKVDF